MYLKFANKSERLNAVHLQAILGSQTNDQDAISRTSAHGLEWRWLPK